jgi:hypothetical protein
MKVFENATLPAVENYVPFYMAGNCKYSQLVIDCVMQVPDEGILNEERGVRYAIVSKMTAQINELNITLEDNEFAVVKKAANDMKWKIMNPFIGAFVGAINNVG